MIQTAAAQWTRVLSRGPPGAFDRLSMTAFTIVTASLLLACGVQYEARDPDPLTPPSLDVAPPEDESVWCSAVPDAGEATGWRHFSNALVEELGSPYHRGHDLLATVDDVTQTITGKVTYGPNDKDLQDEDVDVFACMTKRGPDGATGWKKLGTARTNDNGVFSLALGGDARLPRGMRDLYLSVAGDRTGATFGALVAPAGAPVIVSDIDGTLTASENAYPIAFAVGGDVVPQIDAPAALTSAATRGVNIIYISARGDRFTQDTRDWLAAKGFPRGIVKLPPSIITIPGEDTIEAKMQLLDLLAEFEIIAGIGNRATDIAAYGQTGVPPERIFIKLPEFEGEVAADIEAGRATDFSSYEALRTNELVRVLPN